MKRFINKIEDVYNSTGQSAAFLDSKFKVRWTNCPYIFETSEFVQLTETKIKNSDIRGETGFSIVLNNVTHIIHVNPVAENGGISGYLCSSRTKSSMCALVDQSGMLPQKLISVLKNDINNVINISRILSEKPHIRESSEYSLIRQQIEYSEKILVQYINMAELVQEDNDLEPEYFDIAELCENICIKVQEELAEENIGVSCRWSADSCTMLGIPSKITLMLLNIMQNAISYTDEEEKISIDVLGREKELVFICANKYTESGEPDASTLGMSVIDSIVRSFNGSYSVECADGTYKITVSFPLSEPETLTLNSPVTPYNAANHMLKLFVSNALSRRKGEI